MGLAGGFIGIALAYLDYQPGVEQTPQALSGDLPVNDDHSRDT
ncbi:hypothetical protein ACLK10_16790 [Escherichia coli]